MTLRPIADLNRHAIGANGITDKIVPGVGGAVGYGDLIHRAAGRIISLERAGTAPLRIVSVSLESLALGVGDERYQSIAIRIVVLEVGLRSVRVQNLGQAACGCVVRVLGKGAYRVADAGALPGEAGISVIESQNVTSRNGG